MNLLFAILSFLLAIFILVTVHEYGHFIFAKLFKIRVDRFSVGFGKALWKRKSKTGTEYVIAAIPLGGYVKLLDTRERKVDPKDFPEAFDKRPFYQKFMVLAAGPFFNFLLAFLAFWIVFVVGIVYVKPIVGQVVPDSISAKAGIKTGDQIIAIDDKPTYNWPQVAMALVTHYGEKGKMKVTVSDLQESRLKTHTVNIDLSQWHLNALRPNPLQSLGIVPHQFKRESVDQIKKIIIPTKLLHEIRSSPMPAFNAAYQQVMIFTTFNLTVLYKMLTGVISWKSLGGPLTILEASAAAAGQGVVIYIYFLGLLSISIAIINLIPIPGLDGAQMLYSIIERIYGKPISVRVQVLLFRLGMILILFFMMQVMLNDIVRMMK
jgi:regulator of sigma E protease